MLSVGLSSTYQLGIKTNAGAALEPRADRGQTSAARRGFDAKVKLASAQQCCHRLRRLVCDRVSPRSGQTSVQVHLSPANVTRRRFNCPITRR